MGADISNLHLFEGDNVWLAIDAATLSVFEVDEKVKDYLSGKILDEKEKGMIEEELSLLLKKGYFNDMGKPSDMESILSCYYVSMQNTLECPLNCSYCFAKKIKAEPRNMTKQTAHDTLKFVFETFDDKADIFEVYFTSGGEPLSNFPIIQQVYEEGKELAETKKKKFRAGFTTNGVLMDEEKLQYLETADMGMMLSIDGTEEQHNKNRKFYNGRGSFEYVMQTLEKLKQSKNDYLAYTQALVVLTPDKGSYVDLLKYLVGIGFRRVNMKLVRSVGDEDMPVTKELLDDIKEKYRELVTFLTNEILENHWKYIRAIMDQNNTLGQIIINMLLRKKVLYRCDAGKSKFSILPNGDIYPCDYMSAIPELKMGNIYTGIDMDKRNQWMNETCLDLEECKNCWARYVCAGSCYYSRYKNNNKPDEIECEIMKFLMERVAEMLYVIKTNDESKLKHLVKVAKQVKAITHDE